VSTIKSVKAVCKSGTRNIPTAFEIFTSNNQTFVLKAKDSRHAEQWMQCLQIAVAHSHSGSPRGAAAALWDWSRISRTQLHTIAVAHTTWQLLHCGIDAVSVDQLHTLKVAAALWDWCSHQ